jgi:CO/xanthine dehydrogenase FAD-binding subunit
MSQCSLGRNRFSMTTNDSVLLTSRSRLPPICLLTPSTMEEALAILSEHPDAKPISGGTYLVPSLLSRRLNTNTLVDLASIDRYRYVKPENNSVKIGALATLAKLVESEYLQGFDAINAFKTNFVSPPVMNLATVGGSVALGAYTEDLLTLFCSLGANLRILKKSGEESIPIDKYLSAPPAWPSLILEVDIPSPRRDLFCFFGKLNMTVSRIPFASLSLKTEFDGDVFDNVTLVANCSSDGIPGRLIEASNALNNTKFDKESINRAVSKIMEEASPHSDYLAPAWYRKEALGALLRKISSQARQKVISEKWLRKS